MVLEVQEIQEILPQHPPFLLVDRIIEIEPMKRAVGIKNVTIMEDHFRGHFPGNPIMPGVLILEAMAQVGGVMMLYPEENRGKLTLFGAIDNVKFRKPVVPGDQLRTVAELTKVRGMMGRIHCEAFVEDQLVAQGDFMFVIKDGEN